MKIHNLKTRVIAIAAAMAMLGGLAACTSSDNGSRSGDKTSTLDKVIKAKTLKVGVILSLPPFGMKANDGKPEGYDVDVANLMAKKLGVKLEIVDTTAADRIPNLQTGKVDAVIGQFTRNTERAQVVSFSNPYIAAPVVAIAVKKGSAIKAASDLAGKRVAVIKGTTQDQTITDTVPKAKLQRFDKSADAFLALKQGAVDAMVEDGNWLTYQTKTNPGFQVVVDPQFNTLVDYNSIGVQRGDQEWLNWVNMFVFELVSSNENVAFFEKWFDAKPPIPVELQY